MIESSINDSIQWVKYNLFKIFTDNKLLYQGKIDHLIIVLQVCTVTNLQNLNDVILSYFIEVTSMISVFCAIWYLNYDKFVFY